MLHCPTRTLEKRESDTLASFGLGVSPPHCLLLQRIFLSLTLSHRKRDSGPLVYLCGLIE